MTILLLPVLKKESKTHAQRDVIDRWVNLMRILEPEQEFY